MIRFVQIRAYDNYLSAHIVLARLQDSGINCHLQDEYTITIDPLLSPALGGIKLMVAEPQVERALAILEPNDEPQDSDDAS
ncbi:MAG TPA: DUF2007 domain-containing protein [Puia sp.]|nr:DUF2007 domain-containing protein [Puia sp.]